MSLFHHSSAGFELVLGSPYFDISNLTMNILTSIIANPASVSRICVGGPGFCGISGADGSVTNVNGGYCADVGPPQAQVSGVCSTF